MQKSYECEVATHIGPESCGAARKSGVEALTGERAGRVYSRVRTFLRDADAVGESGRPHRVHRYREVCQSPARSQTPCTYESTSQGNRSSAPKRARTIKSIGGKIWFGQRRRRACAQERATDYVRLSLPCQSARNCKKLHVKKLQKLQSVAQMTWCRAGS
jgi:hypothetical protein